jgi:hypothetical protein
MSIAFIDYIAYEAFAVARLQGRAAMRLQIWLGAWLAWLRERAASFGNWIEHVMSDPPLDETEARLRRDPDTMFLPPPF